MPLEAEWTHSQLGMKLCGSGACMSPCTEPIQFTYIA